MKGDALALVKALRGFGVPESVLEQVQASLVPPKRDTGNAGEKARYRIARLSCTSSGNVLPNNGRRFPMLRKL